jgi:hypothetical protein
MAIDTSIQYFKSAALHCYMAAQQTSWNSVMSSNRITTMESLWWISYFVIWQSVSARWQTQAVLYLFPFFIASKCSIQVKSCSCGWLRSLLLEDLSVFVLQVAVTYKERLMHIAVCLTMRWPNSTGSLSHTDWPKIWSHAKSGSETCVDTQNESSTSSSY